MFARYAMDRKSVLDAMVLGLSRSKGFLVVHIDDISYTEWSYEGKCEHGHDVWVRERIVNDHRWPDSYQYTNEVRKECEICNPHWDGKRIKQNQTNSLSFGFIVFGIIVSFLIIQFLLLK